MTNKQPCCPKFDPKQRDNKTHHRNNKKFIRDTMRTFFHMPRPPTISKKITNMRNTIQEQKAYSWKDEDVLILFNDPSTFTSEILITVDKNVQGFENVEFSGEFFSKVYDWPYNAAPKFMKDMEKYLEKEWKKAGTYYIHNPYCPWCAKHYWHNYAILFAKLN